MEYRSFDRQFDLELGSCRCNTAIVESESTEWESIGGINKSIIIMVVTMSINRLLWVNRDMTEVFSIRKSTKFGDLLISMCANWDVSKVRNCLVWTSFSNQTIILMSDINNRVFVIIECNSFVICGSTECRECTSTKLMEPDMLVCNCTCKSE